MRHLASWLLGSALAVSGCAEAVDDPNDPGASASAADRTPTGRDTSITSPGRSRFEVDAISWPYIGYHFGPVLLGTANLYYIIRS